jgi:hypothetical protein
VEWLLHIVTAHCFDGRKEAFGRHFQEAFFSTENSWAKLSFADTAVNRVEG